MLWIPAAVALILVLVISGLVAFSTPRPVTGPENGPINFEAAISGGYDDLPESRYFKARDGAQLYFRTYGSGDQPAKRLVVLLHGSAWHGMQFHHMAKAIAARGESLVVAPDLRGHGSRPQRRGDLDYIGQFEDDLADLIGHMRTQANIEEVVLGGHSSGGGLVVRFAGGNHGRLADRFVLLAPFLKYNAPTTKPNSGGWASPATGRIIGLSILNGFGLTLFNHLPVISFAMPKEVLNGPYGKTATTTYTFRLNQSFAPRADYESDLRAMDRPLLLVAGEKDEAFHADRYEAVISAQTPGGRYVVLPEVDHIGVTMSPRAIDTVADWIAAPR